MWLNRMSELDSTIHYEVLWLRDFQIDMCEGCVFCLYNGNVHWIKGTIRLF